MGSIEDRLSRGARALAFLSTGILALALAASALADRDAAEYFAGRGDKALKDKDWTAAEEHYRRSLEEDETYLPARFGLAEALLGARKRAAALEAFRRFIRDCEAAGPSKDTDDMVERARKRLKEIDEAGSALDDIIDGHVEALMALARKWKSQDPELILAILRRVLKLRPDHAAAKNWIEKMGESATGKTVQVFNGRDLDGWADMGFPTWQCRDGAIVADVKDTGYVARTEAYFKGDFDVRCEMKLLEDRPGTTMLTLLGAYRALYKYYSFGFLDGRVVWEDETGEGAQNRRTVFSAEPRELKKPPDPEQWTVFELRFRGKEVTALVNGEVVAKEARPPERGEGFIGLQVVNAKAAFRKIEVVQR